MGEDERVHSSHYTNLATQPMFTAIHAYKPKYLFFISLHEFNSAISNETLIHSLPWFLEVSRQEQRYRDQFPYTTWKDLIADVPLRGATNSSPENAETRNTRKAAPCKAKTPKHAYNQKTITCLDVGWLVDRPVRANNVFGGNDSRKCVPARPFREHNARASTHLLLLYWSWSERVFKGMTPAI